MDRAEQGTQQSLSRAHSRSQSQLQAPEQPSSSPSAAVGQVALHRALKSFLPTGLSAFHRLSSLHASTSDTLRRTQRYFAESDGAPQSLFASLAPLHSELHRQREALLGQAGQAAAQGRDCDEEAAPARGRPAAPTRQRQQQQANGGGRTALLVCRGQAGAMKWRRTSGWSSRTAAAHSTRGFRMTHTRTLGPQRGTETYDPTRCIQVATYFASSYCNCQHCYRSSGQTISDSTTWQQAEQHSRGQSCGWWMSLGRLSCYLLRRPHHIADASGGSTAQSDTATMERVECERSCCCLYFIHVATCSTQYIWAKQRRYRTQLPAANIPALLHPAHNTSQHSTTQHGQAALSSNAISSTESHDDPPASQPASQPATQQPTTQRQQHSSAHEQMERGRSERPETGEEAGQRQGERMLERSAQHALSRGGWRAADRSGRAGQGSEGVEARRRRVGGVAAACVGCVVVTMSPCRPP